MYSIQHASPLQSPSPPSFLEINIFLRIHIHVQYCSSSFIILLLNCITAVLCIWLSFAMWSQNIPFASAQKRAPKFLLKLNAFFLRCTHFPRKVFLRVSMGISFDGKTFKKRSGSTQGKLLLKLHRLHFPGYCESLNCCWYWRSIWSVIEQPFNSIFTHLNDDERGAEISFNSTSSLVKWNLIPFDCWSCKCQRFLTFFSALFRNVLNSTFSRKMNVTLPRNAAFNAMLRVRLGKVFRWWSKFFAFTYYPTFLLASESVGAHREKIEKKLLSHPPLPRPN